METCFLVNVVYNDFRDSNGIFEPFLKAGAEYKAMNSKTNGINGH
jgi:methylenetetrahydrofolate reductase (NADPH)